MGTTRTYRTTRRSKPGICVPALLSKPGSAGRVYPHTDEHNTIKFEPKHIASSSARVSLTNKHRYVVAVPPHDAQLRLVPGAPYRTHQPRDMIIEQRNPEGKIRGTFPFV